MLSAVSLSEGLALAADTVTICRIPGRPCSGTAIPNPTRLSVTFLVQTPISWLTLTHESCYLGAVLTPTADVQRYQTGT
jgi:hypothetical protein